MAKGFQKRPGTAGNKTAAPAVTVKLGGDADHQRAETFHPGVYTVKCTAADVVSKRSTGTVSLALGLTENESKVAVNMPPIWLGGGNANGAASTPALDDNRWIVSQMVKAAGKDPEGLDLNEAAKIFVGETFEVELGADQINGRDCNRLVNVAVEQ